MTQQSFSRFRRYRLSSFLPLVLVLLPVLLVFVGMIVPRPLFGVSPDINRAAPQIEILVLSNPIHTDIAIPLTEDIRGRFAFVDASGVPIQHPDAGWLIVGWGGRAFYLETPTWAELKPLPVFRALTVDSAVMHVAVARATLADAPGVTRINIDAAGLARMLDFVDASFTRDHGAPIPIPGAAYGQNDAFFEANGWFNALMGCNTWTAAALREAGLRTGWWTPLPQALTASLALFNDLQRKERAEP